MSQRSSSFTPFIIFTYVDITTNQIGTGGTGVTGTNNDFQVQIQPLILDPLKQYKMSVLEFAYQNSVLVPAAESLPPRPLILCSEGGTIRLNNINTNLLYKGQYFATDTNNKIDFSSNGSPIYLPITDKSLTYLTFQIVRSDNGQPWPFPPNVNITLLLAIYESIEIKEPL